MRWCRRPASRRHTKRCGALFLAIPRRRRRRVISGPLPLNLFADLPPRIKGLRVINMPHASTARSWQKCDRMGRETGSVDGVSRSLIAPIRQPCRGSARKRRRQRGTFRARRQTARAPPTRQVDGNETAVGWAGDDTEPKIVVCQASAWCRAAAGCLKATATGQPNSAAV